MHGGQGGPDTTGQVLTKRPERLPRVLAAVRDVVEPVAWPLPNVWLGTSIESERYSARADYLRAAPASVCFVSLEPLLGPLPGLDLTGITWVVVGGESGRNYRPVSPQWIREIRDRSVGAGVPFFSSNGVGRRRKQAAVNSTAGPGTSCPKAVLRLSWRMPVRWTASRSGPYTRR